jgi:hypothetical protein
MKPGDLAIVIRSSPLKGKTALVFEIFPPEGPFVTFCRCLIEGKKVKIPIGWLEVLDETGDRGLSQIVS